MSSTATTAVRSDTEPECFQKYQHLKAELHSKRNAEKATQEATKDKKLDGHSHSDFYTTIVKDSTTTPTVPAAAPHSFGHQRMFIANVSMPIASAPAPSSDGQLQQQLQAIRRVMEALYATYDTDAWVVDSRYVDHMSNSRDSMVSFSVCDLTVQVGKATTKPMHLCSIDFGLETSPLEYCPALTLIDTH